MTPRRPPQQQSLDGSGFTLVPLVRSHAAALFPVLTDPSIYRYLDSSPPDSVAELAETFARREARCSPDGRELWLNWGLRLASGEWAGHLQATVFEPGSTWVAYVLGSTYRGRGLGRAATRIMVEHLATKLACRRFLANVERDNVHSIRLLQGLGFVPASAAEQVAHELAPSEALYVLRPGSAS